MMRPKHAFPSVFVDLCCDAQIMASYLRYVIQSHHSFGAAGVTESRYASLGFAELTHQTT